MKNAFRPSHRWSTFFKRSSRRYAMPWLSWRRWRSRILLVSAALLAGLLCISFAIGADLVIKLQSTWFAKRPWLALLLTPSLFALVVWLMLRLAPETQGSGIPQALAASMSDDRRIQHKLLSMRSALAKIILTMGGLLGGASTGREGPSIQVAASAMHLLAGRKGKARISSSNLIAAGGGAGIAAAFNTPLGGILFAIEEMCRHRAFQANSTTLIAVIFAGLMSLGIMGAYTYFGRAAVSLDWSNSLWPTILCGIMGGILGGLFSRLLIACARRLPGKIGHLSYRRPVLFAALCGLGTALIGLLSGGLTYGTGYAETRAALEGLAQLPWYFVIAKMLVIWLAFLSRIPGGMFAPALAVGAGIGANVALFFPADQQTAILTLGMVSFLAGMVQTPITAFVIVMEMTANHYMLIPLMTAAVIAHTISRSICPTQIYHALAHIALRQTRKRIEAEDNAARKTPLALPAPTIDQNNNHHSIKNNEDTNDETASAAKQEPQ